MKRLSWVGVVVFVVLSLGLIAGSCDVKTVKLRPGDIDAKLKQYADTKWNGIKDSGIKYAVTGNKNVDDWCKESASVYGALIQAQHVTELAGKDMEKIKDNPTQKSDAKKSVTIALDILESAAKTAPDLIKKGNDLVSNYKDLAKDVTKAPQIATALKDSIGNLTKTVEQAPDTIKKLTNISKKLAN